MKPGVFLALGLAGLVLYSFDRKNQLLNALTFGIVDVTRSGTWSEPRINLKIAVKNPTEIVANLQRINGDLFLNGVQRLSAVTYNTAQIIAPFTSTIITLTFSTNIVSILQSLVYAIQNKVGSFDFRGSALVDNIPMPLSLNYDI